MSQIIRPGCAVTPKAKLLMAALSAIAVTIMLQMFHSRLWKDSIILKRKIDDSAGSPATTPPLSYRDRYEKIRGRHQADDFVPEINGNDGASVLRLANPTFALTRMPDFDYEEGAAFYNELQDVVISGSSLKLYDGDRIYFPGGCDLYPDPFPLHNVRQTSADDVTSLDHAVVVSQFWGDQFYHWMCEGFPRIALMLDYINSNPSAKILIKHHAVAPILLELVGVPAERLVWYDGSKVLFARRAICPSPTHCGKAMGPALRRLKSILRTNAAQTRPDLTDIVSPKPFTIVVQVRDGSRTLSNNDELVQAIRTAQPDASVVEYGAHEDVTQAIRKHYHADIIIGPHGAGLSNLIFAPVNATVIELHPNDGNQADEGPHHVNGCHQRTAKRSGLHSILFLEDNGNANSRFRTNIDRVIDAIARIRTGRRDSIEGYHSWQF